MPLCFGINGVGRIGRALLRLAHGREELVPAAVNDLVPAAILARLLARDTVHGPFPGTVGMGTGDSGSTASTSPSSPPRSPGTSRGRAPGSRW